MARATKLLIVALGVATLLAGCVTTAQENAPTAESMSPPAIPADADIPTSYRNGVTCHDEGARTVVVHWLANDEVDTAESGRILFTLPARTYYMQVDAYAGEIAGNLDAYVTDASGSRVLTWAMAGATTAGVAGPLTSADPAWESDAGTDGPYAFHWYIQGHAEDLRLVLTAHHC